MHVAPNSSRSSLTSLGQSLYMAQKYTARGNPDHHALRQQDKIRVLVSPSSGSACPSTFMIKWHKIATLWKSNKFDFIFSGCCMHVACELWHGPRFMRLADEEEHACALHCLSLCFRKSQKQFMSLQAMESRQEKGLYKRKFVGLLEADFYNDDVNTTVGVVR